MRLRGWARVVFVAFLACGGMVSAKDYTVTLKDASAELTWRNEADGREGELFGKGTATIPEGAEVEIRVDDGVETRTAYLVFQKWGLSPTKASAMMGCDFRVGSNETRFRMPTVNLTLAATYVNPDVCGSVRFYPAVVPYVFNRMGVWESEPSWYSPPCVYDDDFKPTLLPVPEPDVGNFQWSPDGGKTWYAMDEEALLKAGRYSKITFRSLDPHWQPPSGWTYWATLVPGDSLDIDFRCMFSYAAMVEPDVLTIENGMVNMSGKGGTVTMNPKDGVVPLGKTLSLTAKAAKGYCFQGWAFDPGWKMGDAYAETAATFKIEDERIGRSGILDDRNYFVEEDPGCPKLCRFLNLEDGKVHAKAIFRHLSDYRAEDLVFKGFAGAETYVKSTMTDSGAEVVIPATVGCALDNLKLECGPNSYPLTYKLTGKLPAGVKFDVKTGKLTGAPSADGVFAITITATDPAKNSANLTVRIEARPLPSWVAGDFRALIRSERSGFNGEAEHACGVAEVSIGASAKVSAKYTTASGTLSLAGQLVWYPDEENPSADGTFRFDRDEKKGWIELSLDAPGEASVCFGKTTHDEQGRGRLVQLSKDAYLTSPFKEKYYTFAIQGVGREDNYGSYYSGEQGYYESVYGREGSGYGYLTFKTDKLGVAKVTGLLPDGEKIATSAAVVTDSDGKTAHLYVFVSPSSYKKAGYFVADLLLTSDGRVELSGALNAWCLPETLPGISAERSFLNPRGRGGEYGSVANLEGYYWSLYADAALDGGAQLVGDAKGTIKLAEKTSTLSIAFTKATGLFSGKMTVNNGWLYDSYDQYFFYRGDLEYGRISETASLPYNGVMVSEAGRLRGFGSVVFAPKYYFGDYWTGKKTNFSPKISLSLLVDAE